jgi:hypothetical protein
MPITNLVLSQDLGYGDCAGLEPLLEEVSRLCKSKPNDRGGNDLFFGTDPNLELHALWDDALVFAIRNSADYHVLSGWLESNLVPSVSPTAGDYHAWAEQWGHRFRPTGTEYVPEHHVQLRCHRWATPSHRDSTAI